ncbi:hypothetical protein [Halopiger goleimassiliensis]|uniref:hypothetical protein n=1 Tax=Halopiger goleimassiliensis TaxID=1293048 RepID=UPI000677D82F|nr:hypothetical protein [Halopiger goleimassiliensis]
MSGKSFGIAALVALIAGVTEVLVRQSTLIGLRFFGFDAESLTVLALVSRLASVLIVPIGIFAVGYYCGRWIAPRRSITTLGIVLFLAGATGSVATLFALQALLGFSSVSSAGFVLAYLEVAVSTGLIVAVSGLAGLGTYVVRNGDSHRDASSGAARRQY